MTKPHFLISDSFRYDEKSGIYLETNNTIDDNYSYDEQGHNNCFAVEENSFWFSHRNDVILSVMNNYLQQENPILDVGGGNGFVSKFLSEQGYQSILIEPNIQGVMNAQRRGVEQLICGTVSPKNIKKQSLDSIGLFDVIEHIEEDFEFISLLYSLLKNNGKIVITVPAFNSLWSYHDVQAGHFRRYTKKTISKLLTKANFKLEYVSYFFSILVAPNFIFRTIPTKLGLSNSSENKQKKNKQHINKDSNTNTTLKKVWSSELQQIVKQKSIPFGNSLILVASK